MRSMRLLLRDWRWHPDDHTRSRRNGDAFTEVDIASGDSGEVLNRRLQAHDFVECLCHECGIRAQQIPLFGLRCDELPVGDRAVPELSRQLRDGGDAKCDVEIRIAASL